MSYKLWLSWNKAYPQCGFHQWSRNSLWEDIPSQPACQKTIPAYTTKLDPSKHFKLTILFELSRDAQKIAHYHQNWRRSRAWTLKCYELLTLLNTVFVTNPDWSNEFGLGKRVRHLTMNWSLLVTLLHISLWRRSPLLCLLHILGLQKRVDLPS